MSLLTRVRAFNLPAYGDQEVEFFESVLGRYRPTHVFEWGTNVGASARLFYEAALELGYPCEVHTVELPDELAHLDRDHPGQRYGQWIAGLPIHAHRGYGLEKSMRLLYELEPECALFFLDGNHDHGVVLTELDGILYHDPEAVIVIHDTINLTGRAISEFLEEDPVYKREDCLYDSGLAALWPLA